MSKLKDIEYLQMSYSLAEKGKGLTSPNPNVGAVVVNNNTIIGYGYHKGPGKAHAEVVALDRAGQKAQKGTLYITLEPCTHWGKTPPCVDKILKYKLKRIVISDYDANPIVYKKGVQALQQAGIEVSTGLLADKNKKLNETYIKYITKQTPFITVKAAVSLDGKIATKTYDSQWISSAPTREYIHLLRGEYDAILVGINTVLNDDPLLTVRHPNWPSKRLTRIILDSHLRFPLETKIIKTLSNGRILIFTGENSSTQKEAIFRKKGIEVIRIPSSSPHLDLNKIFAWLGKHGISNILIEGGGLIQTSILEKKLADKILLTISPKLIGGTESPTFFQGKGVELMKDVLNLKNTTSYNIDKDIIMEGYL